MDASIRTQIIQLLDEHRIMSLATLRPDGWPQATTVGYVNDGLTLYFLCGKDSQKARNLMRNDRVSLTIDHDVSDPMAISLEPFERQFLDFGDAIAKGRKPMVAGEEGVQAMEIVDAIYRSCRTGEKVTL